MKTIVCLAGIKYSSMKQRPHHFAEYFASQGYRVIYIAINDIHEVSEINFSNLFISKPPIQLTEICDNLYKLPCLIKKGKKVDSVKELLKKIQDFYGINETIFLISFPEWANKIDLLDPNCKLIYDCLDDWESFEKEYGFVSKEVIYNERKLACISNLVLASSKELFFKMLNYSDNVYYIPNSVNTNHYTGSFVEPIEFRNIPKPIVFFMGAIAKWVDLDLIDFLASNRPEYSFVFVGPVKLPKEDLPKRNNIFYLGKKSYEELGKYLKYARVAIIPFKTNQLTFTVSPLKFFEYISSGIPVVSTILPDLIEIDPDIIGSTYDEFLYKIDRYINLSSEEYNYFSNELIIKSREFDWSYTLNGVLSKIDRTNLQINTYYNKFILSSINSYRKIKHSYLISRIIGLFNYMGDYKSAYEEIKNIKNIDEINKYEMAYTFLKIGHINKSETYFKDAIRAEKSKCYAEYINRVLRRSDKLVILEILLLKFCNRILESLNLLDKHILNYENDPLLYFLLTDLLIQMGEENFALEAFKKALNNNLGNLYTACDEYTIIEIIDVLIKRHELDEAEILALSLYKYGLDDIAESKLAEIYLILHSDEKIKDDNKSILNYIENSIPKYNVNINVNSRKYHSSKAVSIYTLNQLSLDGSKPIIGGAERYMFDIALLMRNMGYEVDFYQNSNNGNWNKKYRGFNIYGFDTVNGHSNINVFDKYSSEKVLYSWIGQQNSYKYEGISICHGIWWDKPDTNESSISLIKPIIRNSLKNLKHIVSVDTAFLNWCRSSLPQEPNHKIKYIPNYVDLNEFYPDENKMNSEEVTILYPRRIDSARGIDVCYKIVPKLLEKYKYIKFNFAVDKNNPSFWNRFVNWVNDQPYKERISYQNYNFDEIKTAYRAADIVLIPTQHSEGTSLSCLEAMASGCSIVTTIVGGLPNLIIDGFNGRLVETDSNSLYEALCELIEDKGFREKLGYNAYQTAKAFSKEKWEEKWAKLISNVY